MVQVGIESENGWRPAKVSAESCVWVTVPGTKVRLQLQKGLPATIMAAFAADFNAFVEPLRDPDSASWTPTNSVATSNHLNATAMDLNWNTHPFRVRGTFNSAQMKVIRELLTFYEGTIFWAGDWTDPIDEMHWQMGYGTWNNPAVASFAKRKIRSDGFSTFRRGVIPAKPKEEPSATMGLTQEQDRLLRELHAALLSPVSSGARYKNDGEGPIWTRAQLISNIDATMYDSAVERQAIFGNEECIKLVQRQALSGDEWAQIILKRIPKEYLTLSVDEIMERIENQ